MATCSIPDCERPYAARGLCLPHYKRWRKYGDPLLARKAANGSLLRYVEDVAIPYDGDECLFWPFGKTGQGYALITVNGGHDLASRLVCARTHGPSPTRNHVAAHSCGNGHLGCVAKHHLRWATRTENFEDAVRHARTERFQKIAMMRSAL